jgi:hypothetical protein
MELTPRQREALRALVEEYRRTEAAVTGETIADAVGVHVTGVGDRMRSLKALDLVRSFPGRGYEPTVRGFEVLDSPADSDVETLRLAHGYDRLDVVVDGIDFLAVHDPERCRARIRFRDPVDAVALGDAVVVGPTPQSDLVVAGEVVELGDRPDEVVVDVVRLEAPLAT